MSESTSDTTSGQALLSAAASAPPAPAACAPLTARRLLHVGCGTSPRERLPAVFQAADWVEVRYDIDSNVRPDIVGSITDMTGIASGSIDAVWSSHNLEHLNPFEVPAALAEFHRVLKPSGFVLVTLPDLRAVARQVAEGKLEEPLYISPAGPITALDIIFGHQASLAKGNTFMAHRTGFTAGTLARALVDAGFHEVRVHEGSFWDLWALATMPETPQHVFLELSSVLT